MLHSQTIKCWIFCIPQDHWSCQSLLYMRACVQQLVVCEWTPVHSLYSSGLWRPFYSRPEHNIALPLHHHNSQTPGSPPPPPPRPQCQDDCQANYHYLDCYQTWRYIWPECWLTCNVCSPLSCLLTVAWLCPSTIIMIYQSSVGTNLSGRNYELCNTSFSHWLIVRNTTGSGTE